MKLTLKQAAEVHAAAEEIAQYCSSVPGVKNLPEETRVLMHATAVLASMKMAQRMLVILK